jgi:hypothetical protein
LNLRNNYHIEYILHLKTLQKVGSVNDEENLLDRLDHMRLMRVYHLKGRLGVQTDDYTPAGNLISRADYRHVNRSKLVILIHFPLAHSLHES